MPDEKKAIQPGDVVQLKSGGPKMTVQELQKDGSAWCQWFSGDKKDAAAFQLHSLKRVE
jgi:uncharacterized protein YodC (DUF2158 family)